MNSRAYNHKRNEVIYYVPKQQPPHNPTDVKPLDNVTTEVIAKFDELSIAETRLLYVDALNYGNKFFGRNKSHWMIPEAVEKIKKFVNAATNSGWKIKVFIDAAAKSGEAIKKWKKRREAEVKKEVRDIPQAMSVLLGDAFKENGIEVFYSLEADNDDTIAAYASRDHAAILSCDRDFFRYRKLACTLYGEYEVRKGRLHLTPLPPNNKPVSKRDIILPPPKITDKDPSLIDLSVGVYRRGAPSALVRRSGNIHVVCRSLRQALYSRRGIKEPVVEIFPTWENDQVVWLEDQVASDSLLDHLLDRPEEALEKLFPKSSLIKPEEVSLEDWRNHIYAIHAVVYELCALGSKSETSLLKMLRPAVNKFREEHKIISRKHLKPKLPTYEAICVMCNSDIKLSGKEVLFYQSKGFSMPKRCRECKQYNGEKRYERYERYE